jgi:type IV pilus assembly protein PilY1
MLHAFDATTGVEQWAFIPNSVLKNLKSMQTTHTYYVDSTPKVADVWFYSDPADTTKSWDEWRTVLVCGLRKGGKHYFALDITDTLDPKYLWEFPKTDDPKFPNYQDYQDFLNNKLGQSWSEPAIGRVRKKVGSEIYERWVAFIGGGFDTSAKGRAFFVVDIKTGEIIKEFSGLEGMSHALAAPPSAVDTLGSGYINKVYIGDLGGQMWVFDVSSTDIAEWSGKRLFKAPGGGSEKHPIYYQPAVALDKTRTPWVFFGTGDRENPTDMHSDERFYAVKDDGKGNYPREEEKKDLRDVTTYSDITFKTPEDPLKGWYIQLAEAEKVLAKPAVFYNLLYFTTYTHISTDECKTTGKATLYKVEYLSGGGAYVLDYYLQGTPSKRSEEIGDGIPSAPVISVNLQGKASVTIGTTSDKILSKETISPTTNKETLYWREVIP